MAISENDMDFLSGAGGVDGGLKRKEYNLSRIQSIVRLPDLHPSKVYTQNKIYLVEDFFRNEICIRDDRKTRKWIKWPHRSFKVASKNSKKYGS